MGPVNIMHRSQGHCQPFTSVQNEIRLANNKKAQKHAAVNGMGPFIVLFSSSALLGVSISESDVTWFPFTLVIWLQTNKLSLKLNAEWTWLWHKCTHMSHTHTHIHTHTHKHVTYTHTHTYMHPHPHRHPHLHTHTHKEALSLLNVPCSTWCRNFPIWSHDKHTSLCTPRPTAMVISTSRGD